MSLFSFASWSRVQGSRDDDWADRVSHLWTVVLLAAFTLLVSSAQYVGDPIQCWCPAQFTSECPFTGHLLSVCWQIPNLIWRLLNNTSGLNMDRLVQLAESTQMGKPEDREKTIYQVARYLDRWLKAHRQYRFNLLVRMRQRLSSVFCFWLAKREGRFLTGFYLFIKLLYVVNSICQFFILNGFLSMDFNVYGFEMMRLLAENGELKDSPRFPRVTLCDFEIRQLQNLQRYTVQCVLPINLFNEKIFLFLWFWLLIVAIVACGSYVSWLYYILVGENRYRYAKKYLVINDHIHNKMDSKLARKFANEYLRDDGIFVLRVVSKNSSELVLTDLVKDLWRLYKENPVDNKLRKKDMRSDVINGNVKPTTEMDEEEMLEFGDHV
ncbi:innexin unc-9 [Aplysia californica]|uniref:Innexin n=1 Tax=Aplysia californica TaxID=6500 RepID=A0ABM1VY24_APLCA|nr:innexin unc-9 [Aplysia californica]